MSLQNDAHVYISGIKIFNSLQSNLTTLVDKQAQFKVALKKYLITHSFYSIDEFIFSNNSKCNVFLLPWVL
jgi:hypothetical protein